MSARYRNVGDSVSTCPMVRHPLATPVAASAADKRPSAQLQCNHGTEGRKCGVNRAARLMILHAACCMCATCHWSETCANGGGVCSTLVLAYSSRAGVSHVGATILCRQPQRRGSGRSGWARTQRDHGARSSCKRRSNKAQ